MFEAMDLLRMGVISVCPQTEITPTRPMLGFKTFRCARILLAGIEVMHMIRKGQLGAIKDPASSAANQFYSLAF